MSDQPLTFEESWQSAVLRDVTLDLPHLKEAAKFWYTYGWTRATIAAQSAPTLPPGEDTWNGREC